MSLQYKVPQNVLVEDKILPFMTMKQLIICFIGGTIAYVVYLALERQPTEVSGTAVAIVLLLTAAIAFVRINNIPFTQYILYALERYLLESKRVWQQGADSPTLHIDDVVLAVPHKEAPTKYRSIEEVSEIASMVDAGAATDTTKPPLA